MPDEKRLCQRCGQMKDDVETCEVEAAEAFKIDYCKPCRKAVAKRLPVSVVKTEREVLSSRPARNEHATVAAEDDGLDELSKKELLALAKERGVEVNKRAKKDDVIAALSAAEENTGDGEAATDDTGDDQADNPPNDSSPPADMAPAPSPEKAEGE